MLTKKFKKKCWHPCLAALLFMTNSGVEMRTPAW